ncbi:hypothetical protein GTO27_12920 [Candidatus Bathyarchaeota archaeon]|nr:hypothetical protein [Candidatus Bathyarchaeota archaeon]
MPLRVVVKNRRQKITTCKTSVEVVVPKGYKTTTSEVQQTGAFGNGLLTGAALATKTDGARNK